MAKRKPPAPPDRFCKKMTVKIGGELDFRVTALARRLGLSKADFVLQILEQGIERYDLDPELKAVYAKIVAKSGKAA
jgi:predicted DNA-binding protein